MKKALLIILLLIIISLVYFFVSDSHQTITQKTSTLQKSSATIVPKKNENMTISSSAYENNSIIPSKYTCDGEGVNPPLTFEGVPEGTKSLAMLMDDPDVPKNLLPAGVFDHWVIYNIDPKATEIKENSPPPGSQGLNGAGKLGFTPPCPPDREHRYFFRLYALDTKVEFDDPAKVTKQMVIDKMQGHVIDQVELVGRYNRPQNQNK
jgi:Raf kinase inhibitor-like YbhB/YbcL family protein